MIAIFTGLVNVFTCLNLEEPDFGSFCFLQMMLETLGLVETLEWNVIDKLTLGIEDYDRPGESSVSQVVNYDPYLKVHL